MRQIYMVRTGLNWSRAVLDFRGTTAGRLEESRSFCRGLRCKRPDENLGRLYRNVEFSVCASAHAAEMTPKSLPELFS